MVGLSLFFEEISSVLFLTFLIHIDVFFSFWWHVISYSLTNIAYVYKTVSV